jgi:hypothetical protein
MLGSPEGSRARVLCTANASSAIDAVPTCLAVVGARIVPPIDTVKPKTTTDLGSRANLDLDARATLLTDGFAAVLVFDVMNVVGWSAADRGR